TRCWPGSGLRLSALRPAPASTCWNASHAARSTSTKPWAHSKSNRACPYPPPRPRRYKRRRPSRRRRASRPGGCRVARSGGEEAERGVPRDRRKVGVGLEHLDAIANGDGRDETIREPADRLAVPSTVPEEGRRLLVVGKASGGQQLTAKQKTPQPLEVALVSGARKHLHDDHLRRCQRFAALDQLPQRPVHRSLTSSQVLDPGGRVNQDQRSVTA